MVKDDFRLCDVVLDDTIGRSTPDVEHERAVAIFDLIEENSFTPVGHAGGPYRLNISLVDSKLVFSITTENGENVATHILSLTPFRRIVKEYLRCAHTVGGQEFRDTDIARIFGVPLSVFDEDDRLTG